MTTAALIRNLMERAPAPTPRRRGGFYPDQVLGGARVLKALREAGDGEALLLEDADHKTVVDFLNRSLYGSGEELAQIIVDIRDAKAPAKEPA